MPVLQDRVQETTTTGGTGTITLAGAVTGYRSFAQAFTIGDVTYYTIDNGSGEWEIGVGTVGSGTLSRDSVLESSNSNALVNFGSGTKRVFCSAPTKVLLPNQTSNNGKVLTTNGTDPSWTSTLNGITLGNITPASGAFTTLSASSTVSGTGFSTYLASPPAIGGTTPAAGNFTNLGYTGTLTGGTGVIAIGTNQIYKDSSGNVGIGTSSPSSRLSAVGGDISIQEEISGRKIGFNVTNSFTSPLSVNTAYYGMTFATVGSGSVGISAYSALAFFTTGTERLRIDSSGNVGIGTSSPSYKLDVSKGSAGTAARFTASTDNGRGLSLTSSDNGIYLGAIWTRDVASSYGIHAWSIASSEKMRLDSSGNLGIGTSSPGALLHVYTASSGSNAQIALLQNNGNTASTSVELRLAASPFSSIYSSIKSENTGSWNGQNLIFSTFPSVNGGSSTERLRIDSSGNVGIGTSSPAAKLNVYGTGTEIRISNSSNTGTNTLSFMATPQLGNAPTAKIAVGVDTQSGSPSYMTFHTMLGGVLYERLRIDSSGNLGLGVTPPSGAISNGMYFGSAGSVIGLGNGLQLVGNTYWDGGWKYRVSSTPANRIDLNAGNVGNIGFFTAPSGTAGNPITFTQAMTLDASGYLLVGCTSPNFNTGLAGVRLVPNGSIQIRSSTFSYFTREGTGTLQEFRYYASSSSTSGTTVGTISITTTNTAYNTSSDYRLKENVQPIQNALSRLAQLKPSTYNWIADGSESEGFIAHELQEVVPQAVTGEKDGEEMQGVDYGKLTPLLAAALQELHAEIELLKAQIH